MFLNRNLITAEEYATTNSEASGIFDLQSQSVLKQAGRWPGGVATSYEITYTIANVGAEFQIRDTGTVNYVVDWGDGTALETVSSPNKSHTYSAAGVYTVRLDITGSYRPYWTSSDYGDQVLMASIKSGVDLGADLYNAFSGMDALMKLEIPFTATSTVTNMANMFNGTNYLNSYPNLDTSNVTGINNMFSGYGNPNPAFTGTVPHYDFSEVTNAANLFRDNLFVSSLPAFNLSKCTSLDNAFRGCSNLTSFPAIILTSLCTNFNSAWAYSGITTFPYIETSGGTYFAFTWLAGSNSTLLTSFPALDFSNATTFYLAWGNQGALANFEPNMFDSTGTLNYNAFQGAFQNCALTAQSIENILASLVQNGASGITLHIGGGTNAIYSTWSTTAQNHLATLQADGWNITYRS